MRFSEATGRKVVSTSTAATVAKVDQFVVDPATRTVVALGLKKSDGGKSLPWRNVKAFGTDAVTVDGVEVLGDPDEHTAALSGKAHHLLGKRVLSSDGDELGTVDDVEFDPGSAEITALLLDTGPVAGTRLVGIGSYAVVVAAERVD